MSRNFHDLITAPEMRRAYHLDYSLRMISDISVSYNDTVDAGNDLFARSMIDAFYVHARLLAEFLVKPTGQRDFGPEDFEVEWAAPQTKTARRLVDHWKVASQYVVHFSHKRVPQDLGDLEAFEMSDRHFKAVSADILTVFAGFVRALQAATPSWEGGTRMPDRVKEPDDWSARLLSDRTGLLLQSLVDACEKIGLDVSPAQGDSAVAADGELDVT